MLKIRMPAADVKNWKDRTEELRKLLAVAGYDPNLPLPDGVWLKMFEGRATGHGRLGYGTPIPGPEISLAGMIPANILSLEGEGPQRRQIIKDGRLRSQYFGWTSHIGGWCELHTPEGKIFTYKDTKEVEVEE